MNRHQGNTGYGGGHNQGRPGGQGQDDVRSWFSSVDTDRSGQISPLELQQALVNGNMSKFSEETCKMMIRQGESERGRNSFSEKLVG